MSYTAYMTAAVSEKILLFEMDILEESLFINSEPGIYQITYSVINLNTTFNFGNGSFGYGNFGSSGTADIGNDNAKFKIGSMFVDEAFYAVASSLTSLRSTDSSFYFDQPTSIIYVHFANHDPPDIFDPRTIGIINGYSNKAAYYDDIFYDGRVISVPNFSREKDPLFFGKISFEGGGVNLINTDGRFDNYGEDKNIYGAQARVLLGFDDNDYDDFKKLYEGQIENININEDTFSIEIVDKRKQLSRTLPTNAYDATTYPDIKSKNVGKAIPLAYGTILNAPVICVNEDGSSPFTFKLADVTDHVHGINSIDTVYIENTTGVLSAVTVSTSDLAAGSFTLTSGVYTVGKKVTADFKGFDIVANYDWIDRGNCESITSPMISGETVPALVGALWVRDDTEAYEGTYSYKFTKDVAVDNIGIVYLVDNADTTDMHGLIAGYEYTLTMRILIPSGGILGSEVMLQLLDYIDDSLDATDQVAANIYDEWQTVTVTRTLRAAATGFIARFAAFPTAEDQEFFYVDNIRLSSFTVPRIGQNGVQIIQDLMTTYFPISFDSNFFNTTEWGSAVVAAATVGIFINEFKDADDIIEDVAFSIAGGSWLVKDNGLYSYRIFDSARPVDQVIESHELLDKQILAIGYDTTEVLTSARVGHSKDWNENEYVQFVYTDEETDIFNKFKVYREQSFDTLLINATDAENYAITIMNISGDVNTIIRVRTKMQTIDREISDIVTIDYGKDNRDFLGTANYEVIGKEIDLDNMEMVLTCRKI